MRATANNKLSTPKDFFMPGLEAMVRDGLFPDIETAKVRLTQMEHDMYANKKQLDEKRKTSNLKRQINNKVK